MSLLENKILIIIGHRDGVPSQAIEECANTIESVAVVYSATECFV